MTAQVFLDWVQSRHSLPSKTSAVRKAAQILRVSEITIWKWLKGEPQVSPSMLLLMEMVMRHGVPDE